MVSAAPASQAAPTAGPVAAPPAPETAEMIAPSEDECSDKVSVVLYDRPQHPAHRTATQASMNRRQQGAPPVGQPGDAHAILTLSLDQPRACQVYQALAAMSAAAYAAAPADDVGASPPAGFIRTAFEGFGGDRLPLKAGPQTNQGSSTPAPALFDGAVRVAGGFVLSEPLPHPRTGSGDAAHPTMSFAATGAPDPFSRLLPGAQTTGAQPAPVDPTDPAAPGGTPAAGDPAGVPEPATWLLMILGLFGLGAALRRIGAARPRPMRIQRHSPAETCGANR